MFKKQVHLQYTSNLSLSLSLFFFPLPLCLLTELLQKYNDDTHVPVAISPWLFEFKGLFQVTLSLPFVDLLFDILIGQKSAMVPGGGGRGDNLRG